MMMMLELFILMIFFTVTLSDTGSVITVNKVSVQQEKSIIIPCFYKAQYVNAPKYLCFGKIWGLCKNVMEINPEKVSISDDQTQHIFTVTIKNVTTSDSGLYWCSIEIHGFDKKKEFKLNVSKATPELYVDHQMVTGYEGGHIVISCHHSTMKPQKWCKIDGACVNTNGSINGTVVQLSSMDRGFRVTMSELTMASTGWYWCSAGDEQMPVHITVQKNPGRMSFVWLIILGLLLLLTLMAVIVFMQHKLIHQRHENMYVSMKKPNPQTKQNEGENDETQDYEIMSRPKQALKVQGWNHEDNKSLKKETADLLEVSQTTISRVYRRLSEKDKRSSEWQSTGKKCLVRASI
ncbi:polymeric immunoglobulin receptor-like isoform 2-T2 [Clarias gariepinus]